MTSNHATLENIDAISMSFVESGEGQQLRVLKDASLERR